MRFVEAELIQRIDWAGAGEQAQAALLLFCEAVFVLLDMPNQIVGYGWIEIENIVGLFNKEHVFQNDLACLDSRKLNILIVAF